MAGNCEGGDLMAVKKMYVLRADRISLEALKRIYDEIRGEAESAKVSKPGTSNDNGGSGSPSAG